jgi:peroxiredoxin
MVDGINIIMVRVCQPSAMTPALGEIYLLRFVGKCRTEATTFQDNYNQYKTTCLLSHVSTGSL